MDKSELTKLINTIADAVDESKFGPVFTSDPEGKRMFNNPGLEIVKTVILGIASKEIKTTDKGDDQWKS